MIGSLYTQSSYSILKSTLHLETIFKHAKQENLDFVAITDDNNLHGLYKALVLSKKYQIPLILGFQKTFKVLGYDLDLLIYAQNDEALKSLIELNSLTARTPDIPFESCVQLLNKLIIVLPSTQSFIYQHYEMSGRIYEVISSLHKSLKNFYLGLGNATDFEVDKITPILKEIALNEDLKYLPTYQQSYEDEENKTTYDIVNTIKDSQFKSLNVSMHLLSKNELVKKYEQEKNIFKNVDAVFGRVNYTYLDNTQSLPVFPTKDNVESHIYLYALAHKGLEKRLENSGVRKSTDYIQRLNEELEVIHQMGYDDYFLIVYDFVRFAKTNDILVGPGRGSAAGSLVAYCLGITEVDPIQYDLLFERFLNIDRKSMPDIDLDFPDVKRDLVIDYVKEKYGLNHVVTMTTFTNLTTKTSMRDIARQMNLSQERINAIIASHTKGILDESDREAQKLVKVASTIEGIPRQTGTHPAGIILSKQDLTTLVPLMNGPKDIYQSQLEASDLESLGFLKIDFLGLKNLTMIEDILKLEQNKLKLSDMPLDDKKTFELLSNADVEGVFQLESQGMRNVIRKLRPSHFEDIVALLALFRPGPMQFIDDYIKRRHGDTYEKLDSDIDEILKPTYGIIVYQEQIMKIFQVYAGYKLSEADIIRRAISKKNRDMIDREKARFIEKSVRLNRDAETAEKIYNHIEKFADYGFNRSHSVAYAFIAYYMAYLKTHYYASFISVLMSQNTSNTAYLKELVLDAQNKGLVVYPPNINLSKLDFIPYKSGILAPLTMIKGIGLTTAKKIVELQPFDSYDHFKEKVFKVLNEKSIEILIHANALDVFGLNHKELLDQNNLNQTGFEQFLDDYKKTRLEELPFNTLKEKEIEVLGFNLKYLKDEVLIRLNETHKLKPLSLKEQSIRTIGMIESVKIITTKKGDEMAFVTFSNGISLDLTVFPNQYKSYKELLSDTYVYIEATKDHNQAVENKYIINKIKKVKV